MYDIDAYRRSTKHVENYFKGQRKGQKMDGLAMDDIGVLAKKQMEKSEKEGEEKTRRERRVEWNGEKC